MSISNTNPYNIFALESQRNPAIYERMRINDPVHCAVHPQIGGNFWFLTRYDDCLSFLKDKRFGKEFQRSLSKNDLIDEIINQHMLNRDDPAHARLKALVHLTFTPLRIHHLRPQIQLIADGLFDMIDAEVADGDEFDLTQRYINQLPLMAIASMLGIPMQDYQYLYIWTQGMLAQDRDIVHQAIAEFSTYLHNQIELKVANPGTLDLLTDLIQSENEGDSLNRQELLAMVFLLITAGYETVVNFISNAIVTLRDNPIQLQLLQQNLDNPAIVKTAIEEILRYNGPSHMTLPSWAFEDVEIRNQVIHKGDIVHAVLFAANRDPLVFENPNQFDILRQPNKHIAFSYGIHHCLGASLARLEGEIAITTLLQRIPNL